MKYVNRGPDFRATDGKHKGREYKHNEMYEESDIPEENKAWFVSTQMEPTDTPLNLKPIQFNEEDEG